MKLRNRESYKTEWHNAHLGMALAMARHQLSGRACQFLLALLGEMEDSGRWRQPPESPAAFTRQSKSVRLQARKELMRCGLIFRDGSDPLSWWIHPACWFTGSQRQYLRHVAEYKRLARKPQRAPRFQHEPRAS